MDQPLFDPRRRALHRARAASLGGDLFLHARALEDILNRFEPAGDSVVIGPLDVPGAARVLSLGEIEAIPASLDTLLILGELDASDQLPATLLALRHLLRPGGRLAGCIVGGDSLPRLRTALIDADRTLGRVARRMHPMMDGGSLSSLLQGAGFDHPLVQVDRVDVGYPSLDRLVMDLRSMGCGSALARPAPPLTRLQLVAARAAFLAGGSRAVERFELLHFTASVPR